MVYFRESYNFSRFQRGSNIFQGGGGSNFSSIYNVKRLVLPVFTMFETVLPVSTML